MKRILIATLIAAAACGPRQVEVRTAAPAPAQNAIQLTNGLNQPVNVYVNYNGNDQFIQQVRANTALRLPITGIPAGATVTFKAITVDGTRTYTMQNVVLSGTHNFSVP
ncbi:MAG TPA: hypothetical protein VFO55_03550 [Gemmatimonadaceae bacterium]|nr:hypothetical protein [Gemmatimonadaceae bacterium]